jgi:hypothetical protein
MANLKKLIREPLIHFLLIGGLTFLAYDASGAEEENPLRITVGADRQTELASEFEELAGRPPSENERQTLIAQFTDRELLYREGLALGLDRDDPVVQRRVIQKMEFVQSSYDVVQEPTDTELRAFFEDSADRYAENQRFDFEQISVVARENRDAAAEAARILSMLESGATPKGLGDNHTRGRRYSQARTAQQHGPELAQALVTLQLDTWATVDSERGVFVVRLEKIHAATTPEFDRVRKRVARDWKDARRRAARQQTLERLRAQYEIVVEGA